MKRLYDRFVIAVCVCIWLWDLIQAYRWWSYGRHLRTLHQKLHINGKGIYR